jgi:hypothetical protein
MRVQIRLRMAKFLKNGTSIHGMKHVIVIVGLVSESSVAQEYILQTLAAFGLWIYSDRRTLGQSLHTRAESGSLHAWYPTAQE